MCALSRLRARHCQPGVRGLTTTAKPGSGSPARCSVVFRQDIEGSWAHGKTRPYKQTVPCVLKNTHIQLLHSFFSCEFQHIMISNSLSRLWAHILFVCNAPELLPGNAPLPHLGQSRNHFPKGLRHSVAALWKELIQSQDKVVLQVSGLACVWEASLVCKNVSMWLSHSKARLGNSGI